MKRPSSKQLLALGLSAALGIAGTTPTLGYVQAAQEVKVTTQSSIAKSNADGAAVWEATKEGLQGIEYLENTRLVDLLAPSRYSASDKLNKKTEIFKREGLPFVEITDEMVLAELNKDNLQQSSFDLVFSKVQQDLEKIIPQIVRNSNAWEDDETAYFINMINQHKEEFLLGLSYLYRLYDFNIQEINIKDKLLENPSYFGGDVDLLEWILSIGEAGGTYLQINNNQLFFTLFFTGKITDATSIVAFLEKEVAKVGNITMDEWFKEASKAIIIEQGSKENKANVATYSKLRSDDKLSTYILPLLNVSENSVYLLSNPATITLGLVDSYVDRSLKQTDSAAYQAAVDEWKQELERVAKAQVDFLDVWYRIAKEEDKDELISNRLVIDCLRIKQDGNTTSSKEWSSKFGEEASIGVQEFITPMKLYSTYLAAGAQAEGTGMRYFMVKAASDDGLSTYTHELTHLLVDSVWLNNYRVREGLETEFYPRGLYETYFSEDSIMNLNFVYDYSENPRRVYNKNTDRFQTEKDLQEYTQGMMDVIYTLDYLEAEAVLSKDTSQKQKWYHKFEQTIDTRTRYNQGNTSAVHTIDSVRTITEEEAASLLDWEDLVEQDIVASRYEIDGLKTTGTAYSNGYYSVPLFTANYATSENANGVSGDIITRRQAYELMAEYGYYGGMVPYISNQYQKTAQADGEVLSDTYILGKIFEGKYVSIKEFKKAMFQKRADKLEQLKPIQLTYDGQTIEVSTVDQLKELMLDAVEYDLETVELTAYGWNNIRAEKTKVETLKKEVYTAYLNLTDDFRSSIYMDNTDSENTDSGSTDNGSTDGENTDSGNTDGGSTDGGNTDSGDTDNGSTEGGNTDSGNTDGGSTDGGNTDSGNTDNGSTDGENTDSGNPDNGSTDDE
ncbi:MAG: hypothetical protein IKL49_04510, partial [Lachnospiraceae bacterium]|nr:hypothetical protein [Lachnospiraceae bacterium]